MAAKKDTTKNTESKSTIDSLKDFFGSVTENVKEGVELVTEKIKDNSAKVYVAGTEIVEEANDRIHQYSDKISLEKELKRLESRQSKLINEFGAITLPHYVKNETLHKAFLTTKIVEDVVNEFKSNTKDINAVVKKLKKFK